MNEKRLQELLAHIPLVSRFYHYETIDSTMDQARRLLTTGAPEFQHGTLLVADYQHAGRGRHGRNWSAGPGQSLLASLIVSPQILAGAGKPMQLSHLACAVPVAICRAIQNFVSAARIKYPNDIVAAGRKLGGILLEVSGASVIIGFGINCHQQLGDLPNDLRMPASSLFLETGHYCELELLLFHILTELQQILSGEKLQFAIQHMNDLCETLGHQICIDTGQEMLIGIATMITPDGNLKLTTDTCDLEIPSSAVMRTWPVTAPEHE